MQQQGTRWRASLLDPAQRAQLCRRLRRHRFEHPEELGLAHPGQMRMEAADAREDDGTV